MPQPSAVRQAPVESDSEVQLVLAQIFIAFGQGAGVMRVADQAIVEATRMYRQVIKMRMDVWRDNPFRVREYARTLGHLAAHIALSKKHTIIEWDDVLAAIGRRQIAAMAKVVDQAEADDSKGDEGDCPFCTA